MQDGAEWLPGLVDVLRPDGVRILDFPYAVEHLTTAAQPNLGNGTPTLTAWLDARRGGRGEQLTGRGMWISV